MLYLISLAKLHDEVERVKNKQTEAIEKPKQKKRRRVAKTMRERRW